VQVQERILNDSQEDRMGKKLKKSGSHVKIFNAGELVITVRDVGSKVEGPFKIVRKLFATVHELEDLRTRKKVCRDGSSECAFVCPEGGREGVDPLAVAAQDEGEYVVREIVGHRLE
jgi:hypothetical protein